VGWFRNSANVLFNPVGSFRNFGSASPSHQFLHRNEGPRSAQWAIHCTNTTLRSRDQRSADSVELCRYNAARREPYISVVCQNGPIAGVSCPGIEGRKICQPSLVDQSRQIPRLIDPVITTTSGSSPVHPSVMRQMGHGSILTSAAEQNLVVAKLSLLRATIWLLGPHFLTISAAHGIILFSRDVVLLHALGRPSLAVACRPSSSKSALYPPFS
jgi:hypothetical protein